MKQNGEWVEVPPSGKIARVETEQKKVEEVDGIPVYLVKYGKPRDLPEPQKDTVYLVSQLVLQCLSGRPDVLAPDTSPTGAIRDNKGQIIGVKALIKI
jgi:hypothetical protein